MQVPSISIDVVTAARRSENPLAECGEQAVRSAELRYRKFLALVGKYPGESLSPAKDIDEVWHLHMLHPRAYAEDCKRLFGDILDHDGGFGNDSDQQFEDLLAVFERTATLWNAEYAEPYVHDLHSEVVRCMKACRKACNKSGRVAA
jgi:hypothetical protein